MRLLMQFLVFSTYIGHIFLGESYYDNYLGLGYYDITWV